MADKDRKAIFKKMKKNANEIKLIIESDELQLAKLDTLFRERNSLFAQLKDILTSDSIDETEEKLMQEMIDDNNFILQKMEDKKKEMEKVLNKKTQDAKNISKYSTDNNLKG